MQKNFITVKEKYLKESKGRLIFPRILKVVVNSGIGKLKDQESITKDIKLAMSLITGQEVESRASRQAIAGFKVRKGEIVGYRATMHGKRMYDFLDRLISIVLPRSRDFRGIDQKGLDQWGNLNIGIKESIAFPEIPGEKVKTIFGLQITVVTNSRNRDEATRLFKALGFPLKG